MLAALEKLPRSLEETYDRILERINNRSESACILVERTLCWLFGSIDQLSMDAKQLCEAISINPNTNELQRKNVIDVEEVLIHYPAVLDQLFNSGLVLDSQAADFLLETIVSGDDDWLKLTFFQNIDMNKVAARDKPAVLRLVARYEATTNSSGCIVSKGTAELMDDDGQLFPDYEEMIRDTCKIDRVNLASWVFEASSVPIDNQFDSQTALHLACSGLSPNIVRYLVHKGTDVNHRGQAWCNTSVVPFAGFDLLCISRNRHIGGAASVSCRWAWK